MKSMMKNTGILFLITLVAGCLLGLVYEVIKELIQFATQNVKETAYQEVF